MVIGISQTVPVGNCFLNVSLHLQSEEALAQIPYTMMDAFKAEKSHP